MMNFEDRSIDEILLEMGVLSVADFKRAMEVNRTTQKNIEEILLELGMVSNEHVLTAKAIKMGVEYVDLKSFVNIDKRAISLVPANIAVRYKLFPLTLNDDVLEVATSDPSDIYVADDIRLSTGLDVKIVLSDEQDIKKLISKYYDINQEKQNSKVNFTTNDGDFDINNLQIYEQLNEKIKGMENKNSKEIKETKEAAPADENIDEFNFDLFEFNENLKQTKETKSIKDLELESSEFNMSNIGEFEEEFEMIESDTQKTSEDDNFTENDDFDFESLDFRNEEEVQKTTDNNSAEFNVDSRNTNDTKKEKEIHNSGIFENLSLKVESVLENNTDNNLNVDLFQFDENIINHDIKQQVNNSRIDEYQDGGIADFKDFEFDFDEELLNEESTTKSEEKQSANSEFEILHNLKVDDIFDFDTELLKLDKSQEQKDILKTREVKLDNELNKTPLPPINKEQNEDENFEMFDGVENLQLYNTMIKAEVKEEDYSELLPSLNSESIEEGFVKPKLRLDSMDLISGQSIDEFGNIQKVTEQVIGPESKGSDIMLDFDFEEVFEMSTSQIMNEEDKNFYKGSLANKEDIDLTKNNKKTEVIKNIIVENKEEIPLETKRENVIQKNKENVKSIIENDVNLDFESFELEQQKPKIEQPELSSDELLIDKNVTQKEVIKFNLFEQNSQVKSMFKLKLGDVLVKANILTDEQVAEALKYQKANGGLLGKVFIILGFITKVELYAFLEAQINIKYIELSTVEIPEETIIKINEDSARKNLMIPFEMDDTTIKLAMNDPLNIFVIDDVRMATGKEIQVFLADTDDIIEKLDCYYETMRTDETLSSKKQLKELDTEMVKIQGEVADEINAAHSETEELFLDDVSEAPIVKLVNIIFQGAASRRASDIHIEPQEDMLYIRYRIDGQLIESMNQDKKSANAIVARIKIISGLNIAEKRLPQDGRITMTMNKKIYDMRVSVLPTMFGEKIVIRLADKEGFNVNKQKLGFFDDDLIKFDAILDNPYGIVLVTGPTGSGKSTTLYTSLKELCKPNVNILTVEDPVEATIKGINQVQVNVKSGLTFALALRAFLRQDPDIIMLGEIRDGETAEIAARAAITGHLVLSTLHTNDAASSITRLIDMGIEPYLISSAIVGIIAQRLIRRLCPECKEEYTPTKEEKELIGLNEDENKTLYSAKGCEKCGNIGYKGRIAVHEIMTITREIRELIAKNSNSDILKDAAIKCGMNTLAFNAARLVKEGITTLDEMMNIVKSKE